MTEADDLKIKQKMVQQKESQRKFREEETKILAEAKVNIQNQKEDAAKIQQTAETQLQFMHQEQQKQL